MQVSAQQKGQNLELVRQELKKIILNKGIAWGQGLNSKNEPYSWTMKTKEYLLDQRGLDLTTTLFMELIQKYNPDSVGGTTMASHIIASSLSYLSNETPNPFNAFMVRKERKKNNMANILDGPFLEKKSVVIVDDGLNSAGFATHAIKEVEKKGCEVLAVIVLINFQKNEDEELQQKEYKVEHIFTLAELGMDNRHPNPLKQDLYKLKWRYGKVNASDYTAPKSSPLVVDTKIYVGSDQGKMLCLDFRGELIWEFKTDPHDKGVHQTPIKVDNNIVFAGYDGSIYALNKEGGSVVWKKKVSSYIGASPLYDEETENIYLGLENSTLKGTMACFDKETGHIKWEFTTNNHVPSKPAIWKDTLIFGSNDCFIYALDKRTGELLWKFRTHGENKGRLTIDDGLCYATSFDGHLYCIDAAGKLVWKQKLGLKLFNSALIIDDQVVIGSYSGQITSLDKKTGKINWYFMTNGPIQSYPSYVDGNICVGSGDGCIYIIEPKEGKLIWKFITGDKVSSSPTIHEDSLLVSSNDGYLYCFKKKGS